MIGMKRRAGRGRASYRKLLIKLSNNGATVTKRFLKGYFPEDGRRSGGTR